MKLSHSICPKLPFPLFIVVGVFFFLPSLSFLLLRDKLSHIQWLGQHQFMISKFPWLSMAQLSPLLRVSGAIVQVVARAGVSSEAQGPPPSCVLVGRIHSLTACFFKTSRIFSDLREGLCLLLRGSAAQVSPTQENLPFD